MTSADFLPYGRQSIDSSDLDAVRAALESDYLTTGPLVDEFEAAFAKAVSAPHAVVSNSGTAALHILALGIGFNEGDAVIVPSITFLATANAFHHAGAEIFFADVDPETGLLTSASLKAAIDRARAAGYRPKVAVPVHLGGQPADMRELAALAREEGVQLVEDACHAIGGDLRYDDGAEVSPVGACGYSLAATFSFHPVKTITSGEGGMTTTTDPELAARMRLIRSHGMERNADKLLQPEQAVDENGNRRSWYYEMAMPGFNYRLPDVLCALGLSQLKKLSRFVEKRAALADAYAQAMPKLAPHVMPNRRVGYASSGWHLYAVRLSSELNALKTDFIASLREHGIGTQVHYIPVHRQPFYNSRPGAEATLPGADAYYAGTVSLPLFPDMSESDVHRVCSALQTVTDDLLR